MLSSNLNKQAQSGSPGARTQLLSKLMRAVVPSATLSTSNVLPISSDETGNKCKFDIPGLVMGSSVLFNVQSCAVGVSFFFLHVKLITRSLLCHTRSPWGNYHSASSSHWGGWHHSDLSGSSLPLHRPAVVGFFESNNHLQRVWSPAEPLLHLSLSSTA